MWEYLTEPSGFNFSQSPTLGLFVWWIVIVVGAVLWLRAAPPKNAARYAFRRRTAWGMIVLAGLGILQIIARSLEVPVVQWRLWSVVLFVAFLIFVAFSWWDVRTRLNTRAVAAKRVEAQAPKHITARGSVPPAPTISQADEPMTGRRQARRAKKRKR